jgi:ABC-type sugar transport system permease subunit
MTTLSLDEQQRQRDKEQQSLAAGKRRRQLREALTGYLFVLPAAVATFVFGLWPVVSGFYESVKSGSPITNKYVGLDNYVKSLGSLTYVILFLLCLIFLYLGYRSWRNAYVYQKEYGGNLWAYVVPGLITGAGIIVLAFNFVTGSEAYTWLPVGLFAVALTGFFVADHFQRPREEWDMVVLGRSLLVTLGIGVLWAVGPRLIPGGVLQYVGWVVLVGAVGWLFLRLLPYLARIKTGHYIGASIMMGLLMLLAVLLARYGVAQMEGDVEEAQKVAALIFNQDMLNSMVDVTDEDQRTDTRITNLTLEDGLVVQVKIGDEIIEAPLAPHVRDELPTGRIAQLERSLTNGQKIDVQLPDGSITEGELVLEDDIIVEVEVDGEIVEAPLAPAFLDELPANKTAWLEAALAQNDPVTVLLPDGRVVEGRLMAVVGTQARTLDLHFQATEPEAVREIQIYSALDVGEDVTRASGHTEPLYKQIYATLVVGLGLAAIYTMTWVRRQIDEDYEPDAVCQLFRGVAAALTAILVALLVIAGPVLGILLDSAAGSFPVFTLVLILAAGAALGGIARWLLRLDSQQRVEVVQKLASVEAGLHVFYLGTSLVGGALLAGLLLDTFFDILPVFTFALGGATLLSLSRTIPWLLKQHPSVRRWLHWGRVIIGIVIAATVFYLIASVQLSQQAAAGMNALTEAQFDQAYKYATGEDPPPSLRAEVLTARLQYWPQVFLIAIGALLIGMAYMVWQSAQKRESKLGFGLTLMLAVTMMVGGWLTISELPRTLALGGRGVQDTLDALTRTAMYSIGSVPVQLGLGLFLAYLLFSEITLGKSLFRVIYFMPYIAPSVATSTVFLVIFSPKPASLANQVLHAVGIEPFIWLKEPDGIVRIFYEKILGGDPLNIPAGLQGPSLALTTVILYNIWVFAGYNAVVFLAGLGAIPTELYEAAEVDGAGRWARFRNVTLPLLSPTTFFLTMLSIIGTFKAFSHIYVLRRQSTKPEIDTMSVHIFNQLYAANDSGYAAALAFSLFGMILILTLIQNRLAREQVFYG